MTDPRNALDVETVMDRFTAAEHLLADAAGRVHALGSATETAAEASMSISAASQAITTASEQLAAMVVEMQVAHRSLLDVMGLAREFLETTDISAVREALQNLDMRMTGVEEASTGTVSRLEALAEDQGEKLSAMSAAIDRSAAMERERDAAQQRLASVMQQLPGRVAKKIK
jgi:hypothetical protein